MGSMGYGCLYSWPLQEETHDQRWDSDGFWALDFKTNPHPYLNQTSQTSPNFS